MAGLYPGGLICSIHFEQKDTISTFPSFIRPPKFETQLHATPRIKTIAALLAGVSLIFGARAQETIRMSLTGAEAAEMRRKANSTIGYYNLKLGLAAVRVSSSLAIEGNDNVNNTATNAEADVSFRPSVNLQLLWPVTDQNSLSLNIGAGYSVYVQHSRLNQVFLTPGSELSFDIYAGSFWINLHDRVSITDNSYQDPTVAGTGDYEQFQNALGLSALWDLNKIVLKAGYDHVNYIALGGTTQNRPSGQSEVFSVAGGYVLQPGNTIGVEVGDSIVHYDKNQTSSLYPDANQWNAGLYYESRLSQYFKFKGSAGYTVYSPNSSGQTNDYSGYYGQLAITHRLNQFVDYGLTGGRSISFGFFGGTVDLYSARWQANWHVLRDIALSTSFSYENGTQFVSGSEKFERYGPGFAISRTFTTKLSGSLNYQFYQRYSDLPNRSYPLNIATLTVLYQF
jgi:hypothetical protein